MVTIILDSFGSFTLSSHPLIIKTNISNFFSGTPSKGLKGPKYPRAKGFDQTYGLDSYGDYAEEFPRIKAAKDFREKNTGMLNIDFDKYDNYQKYGMRLVHGIPSESILNKGFNAFKRIKETFTTMQGLKGLYQDTRERRKATMEAFPTASRANVSGLDASSITPGFGFASRATRRDAFRNNQAAQAAIQAALANIKIQNAMLAQIKATKPTINLTSVNNSINTRLSRRA